MRCRSANPASHMSCTQLPSKIIVQCTSAPHVFPKKKIYPQIYILYQLYFPSPLRFYATFNSKSSFMAKVLLSHLTGAQAALKTSNSVCLGILAKVFTFIIASLVSTAQVVLSKAAKQLIFLLVMLHQHQFSSTL